MRIANGFTLFICLVLGVGVTSAQLLTENFSYGTTDNADIRNVSIIAGDTVWARHSGTQGPAYRAAGLTYAGYPLSGIGGSKWFTKGGSGVNDGDVHRRLTDSVWTTANIYVSFMLRLDSAQTTADYFFHLGPYGIGTTFRARFFARSNGVGWSVGLSKSTEAAVSDNVVLNFGQTYLAILKWAFSTATTTDDLVTLYLYATGVPATEPGSPIVTIGPIGATLAGDPVSIGTVAIRQGTNTPTGQIDGIRVATSFSGLLTEVRPDELLPESFALSQNYPNPFNPSTTIRFTLAHSANVSLKIFDMLGREVDVLVDGLKDAGSHSMTWDAATRPTGVYYYQLRSGNLVETKRMVLVR